MPISSGKKSLAFNSLCLCLFVFIQVKITKLINCFLLRLEATMLNYEDDDILINDHINNNGNYSGYQQEAYNELLDDIENIGNNNGNNIINNEQYNDDQIHYLSNSWMLGICIFIGIVILLNMSLICHLKCSKSKHLGNKSINDAEIEQLAVKE